MTNTTPTAVLVVGSINQDLVVSADRLPAPGQTVLGADLQRYGGGKGANAAVAASRIGASVTLLGAVGDDDLGRSALAELEDEGVDVTHVARVDGRTTGTALIVVANGENQIAVAQGANATVDGRRVLDAAPALLAGSGCCLVSFEIPDEAIEAAAVAAASAGVPCVLNPAPARPIAASVLATRPLLTPNIGEAAQLTGIEDPSRSGFALHERTGAPVVVTQGSRGASVFADGHELVIPAPDVAAVVDATGAGDTFNGCLAARLAVGDALPEAAEYAVRAASHSVTRAGARAGMPTGHDLETPAQSLHGG